MWDQPRSTSLVAEIPRLLVPGLAEQKITWGSPAGPKYIIKRLCFSSSKANFVSSKELGFFNVCASSLLSSVG